MAGDTSAVTTGELAAVLQAMDEKYRALFEARNNRVEVPRQEAELKEDVHPLQMPLVKLEGAETYGSWDEHAETILVSRRLEGYVFGSVKKPPDDNSKEGQRWKTTNALVRAWLLSSISPQIAKQVERIKGAYEIWRLLKGTFSGVGNELLACKIQKELHDLKQGQKSIVEYVSELKRLWSDLDYYDPVGLECSTCVEKHSKWTEKRRVRDFLSGLDKRFENRRAAFYGGKLPTMEQAISAIISEETRLKLEETESSTQGQGMEPKRSALFVTENEGQLRQGTGQTDRKCFECGQPGHLKASCPELIGIGRGRALDWRGKGRGRFGDGRRGSCGRGTRMIERANMLATEGETSQNVKVEMTPYNLEKWLRFKGISEEVKKSSEASTTLANASGAWKWKKAWDREYA